MAIAKKGNKKPATPVKKPVVNVEKAVQGLLPTQALEPEASVTLAADTEVIRSEGERVSNQQPRERQPFGVARAKLQVSLAIDGYHLRWINDSAGRIYEAMQSFYQFVSPDEVGAEKNDEGKVKRLVGKNEDGSALYAYLMKIKQEYYEEDSISRNLAQDNFEKQIKTGRLNEQSGENRYIPKQGIKIKS